MKLTAELIEAFAGTFLSTLYDEPKPTPEFHREGWKLYCSSAPHAAIAAPREHAKSTAFTHDFILATVLFRDEDYVILLSSTEEMAREHLSDITRELKTNEDLINEFGISKFVMDTQTDIIVEMSDGHQFRIIARGAGQKIRGRKWKGARPGLIVGDDLEDDEQVESLDRRVKFRKWVFRAARPALRDGGRLRIHGTVIHEDSLLARLMKDPTWATLFYKAHASFSDFTEILWEEKFSQERLRSIQASFVAQQDAAGYSSEYLNDPFDNTDAYLRRDDFVPMEARDYETPKVVCAAADFAVSRADRANRTAFVIGGKDIDNTLHYLDVRVGRWDTLEWMQVMFLIQQRWNPQVFYVEDGVIWKSVERMIYREMQQRDIYINIEAVMSVKDKATRGRSLQRRMRAGACRFDTKAEWYAGFQSELLRFTENSQATLDDQFDAASLLSRGFDLLHTVEDADFMTEEELDFERQSEHSRKVESDGRSPVTGY